MFSILKFLRRAQNKHENKPFLTNKHRIFLCIFAGIFLGKQYSYFVANKMDYSTQHLLQYENEDQINNLIDTLKKPAVIYYYTGSQPYHALVRKWMIKYSSIYPTSCVWCMANIKSNFIQVKQALKTGDYPVGIRLQVRKPKGNLISELPNNSQSIEFKGYKRYLYNFKWSQSGFRSFMQFHNAIPISDPLAIVLKSTQGAIFQIQNPNKLSKNQNQN